jgi:hypothetical protein
MAVKRRNNKRHAAISDHEVAWLRGDHDCGFIQFKMDDELQDLWDRHGDSDAMHWQPGEHYPTPLDEWEPIDA